jgi:hypothetical protein
MSFFKKFIKKSNKKAVESYVQLEEIPVVDSFQQQEEQEFDEVQNNFEPENNWDNCEQEEAGPSWNEEPTWSINDQEITSQPSIEQEEPSSSSSTLTENKNSVNNFKYILELVLFVLVLFTSFLPLRLLFGALLLYRTYLIYPKLLLAEGDYIKYINPFEIMFSQSTISSTFGPPEYYDIENTIDELVNGKLKIEDIRKIQVCIIDDIYYSSDNRRLYCFQEAIKRGLKVEKIPVKIRRVSDLNIDWKLEGSYKIVRNNNFKNIIVSPHARNGRVVDKNGYWDYREI